MIRVKSSEFRICCGIDGTAGLVAAARTLEALARLARERGIEIREETRVEAIGIGDEPLTVRTDAGELTCERLVVTAGPWASSLLPFLEPRLSVTRQTIGYVALEGSPADFAPDRFPVWATLEAGEGHLQFYGLPAYGQPGVKVARHVVEGRTDDPEVVPDADDDAALDDIRAFVERTFRAPFVRFAGTETCLYTCTATEDFVLDLHPADPRIAIGAGFSGHGFKFGPLTGRILAELAINGSTTVGEFEAHRNWFRVSPV